MRITIKVDGLAALERRLDRLGSETRTALSRVIEDAAIGIHEKAHDRLSGPRRSRGKKARRGLADSLGAAPGSYPVPIVSGHLRRSLAHEMTGPLSARVFNPARYASVIIDGTHSSSAHGKRNFLGDAVDDMGGAPAIRADIEREIDRIIRKLELT